MPYLQASLAWLLLPACELMAGAQASHVLQQLSESWHRRCAPPDEIKGLLPKLAEGALAQGQIAAMPPKYALDPCSSLVLQCRMALGLSDYLLVVYWKSMKPGPWHAGQASLWSRNLLVASYQCKARPHGSLILSSMASGLSDPPIQA
jgi:hypothetical protein